MVEGLGVLLLLFLGTPAVIVLTAIGDAIGVRLDRWITSLREY
jgi:ABC-type transport system involved in cytochrome c biogenesis permease component